MSSVPTPPSTTLSTPSPTERPLDFVPQSDIGQYESRPSEAERAMIPLKSNQAIYLIVATTLSPPLGIGLKGSLPWAPIRADMAFFRRVTSESRPRCTSSITPDQKSLNAVVMGRKTWDSIPPRFRPLAGRLNVITTRSPLEQLATSIKEELDTKSSKQHLSSLTSNATASAQWHWAEAGCSMLHPAANGSPILITNDIDKGIESLQRPLFLNELSDPNNGDGSNAQHTLGNIFIIGGSEIYQGTLDTLSKKNSPDLPLRVLQTQVRRNDGQDIDCDTFFPEALEGSKQWQEVSRATLEDWVGTAVPQGANEWRVDGDMEIRVVGWEKAMTAFPSRTKARFN